MRAGARALTASPAPATTAPAPTPSLSASSRARPSSSRLTSAAVPSCCSTTTQTSLPVALATLVSPLLAKDVLLDQLVDERFHAGFVRLHHARLALREHDALDLLHARGRAAQAERLAVGLEGEMVPLHDLGAAHGLAVAAEHADLGRVTLGVEVAVVVLRQCFCRDALVGHHQLDARRPRLVGLAGDREQTGERGGERLEAALDGARGGDGAIRATRGRHQLVDAAHAGDLRIAQLLGGLRAHLRGVAVDRLAAAEHEVAACLLYTSPSPRD